MQRKDKILEWVVFGIHTLLVLPSILLFFSSVYNNIYNLISDRPADYTWEYLSVFLVIAILIYIYYKKKEWLHKYIYFVFMYLVVFYFWVTSGPTKHAIYLVERVYYLLPAIPTVMYIIFLILTDEYRSLKVTFTLTIIWLSIYAFQIFTYWLSID